MQGIKIEAEGSELQVRAKAEYRKITQQFALYLTKSVIRS